MKALELLGRLSLNMCIANPMERIAISGTDVYESIIELEALQSRSCEGCWYGKTTINSVICGKNGTYKEADDYCKYYNPKEQWDDKGRVQKRNIQWILINKSL